MSALDTTSPEQEDEVAANETKLFAFRKHSLKFLSRSNSIEKPAAAKLPKRSKSFSIGTPGVPLFQSPVPKQTFLPPRPGAPTVGPLDAAAHRLFSAGLNFFHGLTSAGGISQGVSYGVSYTVGRRPYMEDRHVTLLQFGHHSHLFGVFDGHGGDAAAQFCADNLPAQIRALSTSIKDNEKMLKTAFEKVDADFCKLASTRYLDDGTTAVVALVRDGVIWCANAGDSRCILSRNAKAVELSFDHKPNREDERLRISALGGFVKHLGVWRLQGVLAVSRAVGDLSLKPFVTCTPEVTNTELGKTDQFIVMASDGLWDVLDNQEVVDILHTRPNLLEKPENAARVLVTEAYKRGSCDNITVLVVVFDHNWAPTPVALSDRLAVFDSIAEVENS
eukprot:c4371_g1_i2.p1 GENE.c4371_g1_i2~~c4371_g1_i2.p1  ORF type:complete len:391 (+),score=66.01 c4371_g1_i2:37-1209(+)